MWGIYTQQTAFSDKQTKKIIQPEMSLKFPSILSTVFDFFQSSKQILSQKTSAYHTCFSVVYKLRPKTPRQLLGEGLSRLPWCRRRLDMGDLRGDLRGDLWDTKISVILIILTILGWYILTSCCQTTCDCLDFPHNYESIWVTDGTWNTL